MHAKIGNQKDNYKILSAKNSLIKIKATAVYYCIFVDCVPVNTYPEMSVPLIHCIIDYILSLAMPDLCQMLL